MRLFTAPGVFKPRSDSWLLAELLAGSVTPDAAVLDLCSGSGVLAIAAARAGAGEVVAVDVSRAAAVAAALNARLNGVRIAARVGDLFEAVGDRRFDLVVSNPPYLPGPAPPPVRGAARAWEGGHDGRIVLDRICAEVAGHLRPGGAVMIVHSTVCDVAETIRRLDDQGLESDVLTRRRGPLGPLLAGRAAWLGLRPGDDEEIVVVRGRFPR